MKVNIKKLHPDAVIPKYATSGSAGFDFVAIEDSVICPNETELIKTGLAMAIPEGFELQVRPRSGLSLKTKLRITNSPGTVDSDYRNEICIIMENTTDVEIDHPIFIKKGDRIAQGVICPVFQADFIESDDLDETSRKGGFGSTGN